jgi:hypothetical protein
VTALWTKLRRDLWHSRGQGLAIGLVVACAVATSAGSVATARALARSRDLYYARAAMPDVFAEATRVPELVAWRLGAIPGVVDLETRAVGEARVAWAGGTARVRLISVAPGGGRLGRLHLREGRLPSEGEGVISEGFARANGLHPGARLSLVVNGRLQRIIVSGVVLSPEYVYAIPPGGLFPDDRAFGLIWMPRKPVEAALDLEGAFDQVVLRLAPGARAGDVIDSVDAVLAPFGGLGAYGRDQLISNRFLSDEIRQLDNMATVLPAIFLGVAAFLVSVALSRLVAAQRMQVGTLKAIGYGDGAIGAHYAAYAAAISIAGAAAGIGMGYALGAYMSRMYTDFYRFPVLDYRADPGAMPLGAALGLGLSALSSHAFESDLFRIPVVIDRSTWVLGLGVQARPSSSMLCVFLKGSSCNARRALSAFSAACCAWNATSPHRAACGAPTSRSAARRSSSALASQARASSSRASSGGMEEAAFPDDGARERRLEPLAALEPRPRTDQNVGRHARAPQDLVGESGAPAFRWGVVRHDEQEVVVAVRPDLSARPGAEEVHAFRLVGGDEPAKQFRQRRIAQPVGGIGHRFQARPPSKIAGPCPPSLEVSKMGARVPARSPFRGLHLPCGSLGYWRSPHPPGLIRADAG